MAKLTITCLDGYEVVIEAEEGEEELLITTTNTTNNDILSGKGLKPIFPSTQTTRRKQMIELKDTIDMMTSADYKDRFRAEYYQTKIRYDKLETMLIKYEAGTLGFEPTCPLHLLDAQLHYMGDYITCLKIRAEMEGIEL